jgi:hypothetical protein
MNRLVAFEQAVRDGQNPNQLRQHWQAFVQAFRQGSINGFERVPTTLDDLERWTGFRVRLEDIELAYRLGGCLPVPPEVFDPAPPSLATPSPTATPTGAPTRAPTATRTAAPTAAPSACVQAVVGQVTDAETSRGIAGVPVRVGDRQTTTDGQGRFSVELPRAGEYQFAAGPTSEYRGASGTVPVEACDLIEASVTLPRAPAAVAAAAPTAAPTARPTASAPAAARADSWYIFKLTNVHDSLAIGQESLRTRSRCSFSGGGRDCGPQELVTAEVLAGPFDTQRAAEAAFCAGIRDRFNWPLRGEYGTWTDGNQYMLIQSSVSRVRC